MSDLSHVGPDSTARMVDVGAKPETVREARAAGEIRMSPETLAAIRSASLAKGDVLAVAKVAGIMAAKRTADLIPLCHPLPLTDVDVRISEDEELPGLVVEATARTVGRTGVEMEALTAVSVTLLTIYDMAKSLDKRMTLGRIRLLEKSGGRSGPWRAE